MKAPKDDKRPPIDLWLLEDMLAANDGRCGCQSHCSGKEKLTMATCQRGHRIKRKPDGSNDTPDNLFPICGSCNRGNSKSEVTPADALRPDFFLRLGIRIFARIPAQYHCNLIPDQRNLVLTTQPTENSYVIDLKNSQFDAATEVYYLTAQHGRKLTADEAGRLLDHLISEMENAGAPAPALPEKLKLISAIVDHGADALARVGRRMMRKQIWRVDVDEAGHGRTDLFFWTRVIANFGRLDEEERKYEKGLIAAKKREEERIAEWQRRSDEGAAREAAREAAAPYSDEPVGDDQSLLFSILKKAAAQNPIYAKMNEMQHDDAYYHIRRKESDARARLRKFLEGVKAWRALSKDERAAVRKKYDEDADAAYAAEFGITRASDSEGD